MFSVEGLIVIWRFTTDVICHFHVFHRLEIGTDQFCRPFNSSCRRPVFFNGGIKEAFRDVRTQVAALNTFVQEHITGMNIVQIFNRNRKK